MIQRSFFRNVQRSFFTGLAISAFIAFPNFTHAADQVVTNNDDDGAGSLRQAVADVGDGEEITFNLSSGNETISLSSPISITNDEDTGFTIDGTNTDGSGVDVTVQVTTPGPGGSAWRVFTVGNYEPGTGKTLTFTNMTIKGGDVSGAGAGARDGGAIPQIMAITLLKPRPLTPGQELGILLAIKQV